MSEENKNQYTFENETYRKTYWHTCSHVLAQAMKRLHPEVKLAIGPAIENGFYYDFDTPEPFSETQLAELEAEGHSAPVAQTAAEQEQMSLLDVGAAQVADVLRRTAVETLTPIEAMNLLYELKQKL